MITLPVNRVVGLARCHLVGLLLLAAGARMLAAETIGLSDTAARLEWTRDAAGWKLSRGVVRTSSGELPLGTTTGEYAFLYSATAPLKKSEAVTFTGGTEPFPEKAYKYNHTPWAEATTQVALNMAGEERRLLPDSAEQSVPGALTFRKDSDVASLVATWALDPSFPGDVAVTLTLTAKRDGFFSLATPTLAHVTPDELAWATVPGYFQGRTLNPDLPLALAYGHGLPNRPVLARERGTATLASILTHRNGATVGVVAAPGTAQDPWPRDAAARRTWRLGLSHMNRAGQLTPTLYHPVLGEEGSKLAVGESRTFRFRYVLRAGDWFAVLKHVANDIYRLSDFLAMRQPVRSLSDRLLAMHRYVTDDRTSLWRTEEFGGMTIGAQAYLGGVLGSDKDAMKNSDYGAMWMLAKLTQDPKLTRDRLPYARNFKLAQQQREPGFFQGAASGQYYLSKSRRFTEEWGNYVEPVALTYYALLDLGNMSLFEPADAELRERVRLGADRLLAWQKPDGSWNVAYDHETKERRFAELPDYRPTFYGLIVAYRVLGDEKYLAAARRGADWIMAQAVAEGRFLGVCGDNRFVPDFATAQIAQALLDLHDITREPRYRDAAIATARFYTTAIFTHPLATTEKKRAGGAERFDWEIAQMGLGFEHGGTMGSATSRGPILLASHAGMFIRMYQLTGEPLFRDMARAGALARDAFVDAQTSVASYYWDVMNRGPGPYPHHAWWQIGWITDYLMAEVEMRSAGQVVFPHGFFTPKVGPHLSYGFAPGKIVGEEASLGWGRVELDVPYVDTLVAHATRSGRTFIVLLNQRSEATQVKVSANAQELTGGKAAKWGRATLFNGGIKPVEVSVAAGTSVPLAGFGWAVLALDHAK